MPTQFASKDGAGRPPVFIPSRDGHAIRGHHARRPHVGETDSESTSSSPLSDGEKRAFPMLIMAPHSYAHDHDVMPMRIALDASDCDYSSNPPTAGDRDSISPTTKKALTAAERRMRRNEKERLRVKGVHDNLKGLRAEATALESKLEKIHFDAVQFAANSCDPARLKLLLEETKVKPESLDTLLGGEIKPDVDQEERRRQDLLCRYIQLMTKAKEMQEEKFALEKKLQPRMLDAAAVATVLDTHVGGFPRGLSEERKPAAQQVCGPALTALAAVDVYGAQREPRAMDPMPLLESMLKDDPMTPAECTQLVQATCREMMDAQAEIYGGWKENVTVIGWKGSMREDVEGERLQFKLTNTFQQVTANELIQKTWNVLTNLDEYLRIQPQTRQLRVLQRVSDDSWIVAYVIDGRVQRHSLILVARAIIHGGYLITYRSLPLLRKGTGGSEAMRRHFLYAETGGTYTDIHSWYNFQERPSKTGDGVECEVIFGGTVHNRNAHFLKEFHVELLSGISRWQAALDLPHVAPENLVNLESADEEIEDTKDLEWCKEDPGYAVDDPMGAL